MKVCKQSAHTEPSHDQVAVHAFQIWQREGRPEGHAEDHWNQAEREALARLNQTPSLIKSARAERVKS